jgi:hypothetical protein
MSEIWKPVPGYEGAYEVSNLGRVRSLDRIAVDEMGRAKMYPGRIRATKPRDDGYIHVCLFSKGRSAGRYVHDLVAAAFIGPKPHGQEVCHRNGIKWDNRDINLRYDTAKGNAADRIRHETQVRGSAVANARLTEQQAREALASCESSARFAARIGVSKSTVKAVRTGQNWRHIRAGADAV